MREAFPEHDQTTDSAVAVAYYDKGCETHVTSALNNLSNTIYGYESALDTVVVFFYYLFSLCHYPILLKLKSAFIKNITTKSYGSRNSINTVKATFEGLKSLRSAEKIAALRGKTVEEILG